MNLKLSTLQRLIYSVSLSLLPTIFSLTLSASPNDEYVTKYSQNTYGGIGLIQTPSARFSSDGELMFGVSSEDTFNRVFSKMQFFPWMEAVVRYTEGTWLPYNPGSDQTWKDKGVDLKFKLYESNKSDLNIALGFSDLGGTGGYSSEYIVASKAINNFDVSLGLGWGWLGGADHFSNFLASIDKERKNRGAFESLGGTINLKRFFSGDKVAAFGGVEYFTPIENLSLKLEYDPTDYSGIVGREKVYNEVGDIFELDSRINYALNYRINFGEREKIDFTMGFVRGNTIYANFAVHSNLNFSGSPKTIIGGEKIRNTNIKGGNSFVSMDENRRKFLFDRTTREMANIGIITHSVTYNEEEIIAEISQSRFLDTYKAIDLATRVLANNSPKNIKLITIINIDYGIETLRSTVSRNDLIKSVKLGPLDEDLVIYNLQSDLSSESIRVNNDFLYPNFYWEIKPRARYTLQHQEQFFFWQIETTLHSVYSIKKGLYLTTDIGINLANNFQNYTYHIPDGQLHNVRQDRRLYLTEGESGLRSMSLDYMMDLSPNLKAILSFGYLEWMYGGAGGEFLYTPDHKRWAIGVDAFWVKQRDYDQKFSFQDYETVTGFLNFYRDIPFYDMRLKLSAGKFLGKDVGALIDVSRRFASGARVGGFAALTDCDSECVGEGSFHKGIYFELPMNLFYIQSTTRNKTGTAWSPLTKNAGAKLERGELYEIVTDASDEMDYFKNKNWSFRKIFNGFRTKPHSRNNLQ